jgi:membrane carboxypeptidase/penicillin-binding protein
MSQVASGVTGASPIWQKIMAELLKEIPDQEFPQPEGLVKIEICPIIGTLPCNGCGGKWEYFLAGTEPKIHCVTIRKEEKPKEEEKIISRQIKPKPSPKPKPPPPIRLFNRRRD